MKKKRNEIINKGILNHLKALGYYYLDTGLKQSICYSREEMPFVAYYPALGYWVIHLEDVIKATHEDFIEKLTGVLRDPKAPICDHA